ncbi:hypothetical protein GTO27_10365, partial [Candidatus Bathyarchaeota archaeon]|nr:hypothetical protein [Candidatus Bathyarchaeota archaeon]
MEVSREDLTLTGLQRSKIKSAVTIVLILTATMVTLSFLKLATAQTEILSITPTSGFVGSVVELTGNISTENGAYVLQFDEANLTSGIAVGYEINATFEVPDTFAGNHNVTLIDKDTGENDTTVFEVLTSYELKTNAPILPKQLQEGDNVTIFLYVAGGEQTITMDANVTVRTPRNESYTKVLNLTISDHGNGSKSTVFPDDFPNGANTNYTGEYSVLLNGTLANQTFLVGLTDSLEYHRSDLVNVRATGYRNNENVTITVSFEDEMIHTENVTADKGVIDYSGWVIPKNASMGIYALNITSISIDATKKDPPDFQNFSIPGYSVNVTTKNLAKEPVSNVIVRVYENTTSIMNATSNSNGVVNLMLERGNYTCEADFKDVKVGELALSIVKEASFDLYCNLTNLHILVKDESDYLIPEAEVELAPENLVLNTNINGTAIAHSLLPNVTYTLNSSRYGEQFNTTTIEALIV